MMETDVLITGAGLTGLSCAFHLEKYGKRDYLLAEKSGRAGGLSGSAEKDGFVFDYSGHLLHLHDPEAKKLILALLKGNLSLLKRNSWIFSNGVFTRYPFQSNTYGLPEKVVSECVSGFLKAYGKLPNPKSEFRTPHSELSFHDWALSVFGPGICRHFMFPYNSKLWQYPLSKLGSDWCAPFVPRPDPEEVIRGAYWDREKNLGYNAYFRYPLKGGCQAIPDAFAGKIKNIRLNAEIVSLDIAAKTAYIKGLGEVKYRNLVNTIPLSEFLGICRGLPGKVASAGEKLKYRSVYVLNMGVDRKVSDKHWTYFPEPGFPFYRAGIASNFSGHVAPEGTSSFYIEVSRAPASRVDPGVLEKEIKRGLASAGFLRKTDNIIAKLWQKIDCGYIIYDSERKPSLGAIFEFLGKNSIHSIGRYGGWKYSFMEESVIDGKKCAEELSGGKAFLEKEHGRELKALK